MIGLIGSILGFFGEITFIVVLSFLLGTALSNSVYRMVYKFSLKYEDARTWLLGLFLKRYPSNERLRDLYRRSRLHLYLCSIENYMVYLTDAHGGFVICGSCRFPYAAGMHQCPHCSVQRSADSPVRRCMWDRNLQARMIDKK
ncbi:MAG TPA: hypothetical protein PK986_07935 [Spirochaetota bacterium]|nr:hypothetical protein [Spirochaetota bacterium]